MVLYISWSYYCILKVLKKTTFVFDYKLYLSLAAFLNILQQIKI